MRARDRQEAIIGWLRGRGSSTVPELAARFDVSQRTIHRDVLALRERGIPVDGEPGRGGGLRLDPVRSLAPIRLELEEIVGLVLAVTLASSETSLVFGRDARTAVDKIMAALPEARARDLRRLLSRVLVAQPASTAVRQGLGPVPAAVLRQFEAAFHARSALGFRYVDRHGNRTSRRAEPHGLLVQSPAWYLLAFDLDRGAPRMFRLDRIRHPRALPIDFRPRPLGVFEPLLDDAVETRRVW